MKMRDAERQKAYNAEYQLGDYLSMDGYVEVAGCTFRTPALRRFTDIESVERYVRAVEDHLNWEYEPLGVRKRKGEAAAHFSKAEWEIAIPEARWALNEITVLHEVAHAIVWARYGYRVASHGPEFRVVLSDTIESVMGPECRFLYQICCFDNDLTL